MIPFNYNFRSVFVRKTTTLAAALGIALVVFVTAGSLMLASGVQRTMSSAGRPDHALVVRKGSDTEMMSSFETKKVPIVLAAEGVSRDPKGAPIGAAEMVVVITMEKVGARGQLSNVMLRATSEASRALRPEVTVVAGRSPKAGTDEVMVGKGIASRFTGMQLGGSFEIKKNRRVSVVGVFESAGSSFESEVWADLDTVRSSFGRAGKVSSVTARLDSPAAFDAFKLQVETDKELGLEAFREDEYYRLQSENTSLFVGAMGVVIAGFASVGAMIGALNTMLAAVAQRQREIGTLRALGFSRFAILSGFLVEAVLLALAGSLLGLVAAGLLTFVRLSMVNFSTWQEVSFRFDPDPAMLGLALVLGASMGVVGGFVPALRASRVSAVEAMRA